MIGAGCGEFLEDLDELGAPAGAELRQRVGETFGGEHRGVVGECGEPAVREPDQGASSVALIGVANVNLLKPPVLINLLASTLFFCKRSLKIVRRVTTEML